PAAFKVSVVAVVQLTVALTVISPASAPLAPVLIVTLVPPFSVVWIVPLLTLAPEPLAVTVPVPAPVTLLSAAVLIVVLKGSSSQVPPLPWGALASTTALLAMLSVWPEVSTQPPSPPLGPP